MQMQSPKRACWIKKFRDSLYNSDPLFKPVAGKVNECNEFADEEGKNGEVNSLRTEDETCESEGDIEIVDC